MDSAAPARDNPPAEGAMRDDEALPVARPWAVLIGLTLGVAVTNGFARFAYGLILPAMRADRGWSYAEAGWLNTANALGYVAGALATLALVRRVPASRLFAFGMVGTAVCLAATGFASSLAALTLARVLTGAFAAAAFTSGGALSALLWRDEPRRNALAIALYFGLGGGVGMILPGATLPFLFAAEGPGAWPAAWLGLGAAGLATLPFCLYAAARLRPPPVSAPARAAAAPARAMAAELFGYFCFGLGYIVYVTFLAAWLRETGAGPGLVAAVWVTAGAGIAASPFLWRPVFARFASGLPLALVMAVLAAGALLPLLSAAPPALLASALLFGFSLFMAPGAVTSFSRRNLPQAAWGPAMSLFTLLFAVGQTIGPVAAGWIGDRAGGIAPALLAGGLVLLLGSAAALLQRPLRG